MIPVIDIKLTRDQLAEVLQYLPNNFIQLERKVYTNDLTEDEQSRFSYDDFFTEKLNALFEEYPEVMVSVQDKIYGVEKGKYFFVSHEPGIYETVKQLYPALIPQEDKSDFKRY